MNEPRKVSTYISPDVEDLVPCEPNCDVERRKSVRHKASQFVALKSEQAGNIAELVDISNYGAKIRLIDGATLMINERVVITFINHAATECKVVWQENEHIGILFREPFDHAEEALTIEHLGNGYFVEIKRLQNAVRGT